MRVGTNSPKWTISWSRGAMTPGSTGPTVLTAATLTVAVMVGVAIAPAAEAIFGNSDAGIWSGVVLVFLAGAPTANRLRKHPLDAPGLYAVATMLFLGLTSLAWLGEPISPGPGLAQAEVSEALRLVAVGLACFGIGVWILAPSAGEPTRAPLQNFEVPAAGALYTVFAVSLAAVLVSFALGTYGYISDTTSVASAASYIQLLSVIGVVGNFVLIATAISYYATSDRRLLRIMLLFVTTEMIVGFVGGNKQIVILPLLLVLGAYLLARKRIPLIAIGIATVFFFVIVIPTNLRYREGVRGQGVAPQEALTTALGAPIQLGPGAVVGDAQDYLTSRFRSIDSIALVVDQTPSTFPFADGKNYALLPAIALAPRALWPDKPSLSEAGKFTNTYAQRPTEIVSATQITQIGDLYRNFGYAGTLVALFGLGLVFGGLARAWQRHRSPRTDLIYIYAAATVFIYVDSDLPALLATASKTLPAAAAAAWLLLPGRTASPGYTRLFSRFQRAA